MRAYGNKNSLYNAEVYPGMTNGDAEIMDRKNRENQYGITYDELMRLIIKHRVAREKNNVRTMSKIEYRLTDINFHYGVELLKNGDYKKAREIVYSTESED